jgi:hypothetical protein
MNNELIHIKELGRMTRLRSGAAKEPVARV